MSVRGRHVETSKEQVAIVVYNGHVAVEEVNEVVHKEAGKLDGDQIWAQIAWALLVVNFILWLCVQVILKKIRLSAVFFLFPGVFLMLSNGNRWHEQLSAYSKHCSAQTLWCLQTSSFRTVGDPTGRSKLWNWCRQWPWWVGTWICSRSTLRGIWRPGVCGDLGVRSRRGS